MLIKCRKTCPKIRPIRPKKVGKGQKKAKKATKNSRGGVVLRVDIDPPEYRSDYNTEGQ